MEARAMINLNQLRVFYEAAKHQSFTSGRAEAFCHSAGHHGSDQEF